MLTEVGSVRVIERAIVSAAAAAAATALTLPAAAPVSASGPPAPSWPQPRYGAAGTGYNPNETQLSVHNVSELVTRAATPLARPVSAAPPVIADGLVIVTGYATVFGQPGEIEAFPETCGAPYGLSCPPVWTAVVSYDDSMGVTVADGKVFANTLAPVPGTDITHQKLWVFSVHCGTGGAACAPLWTTTFPGESDEDEAPVVAGGVVYVPHGSVDHSFLYALPASCSPGCRPLWRGRLDLGADDSATVADGFVYMPDYDGELYAFRAGCASGGAVCSPAWHGSVGEGGPRGVAVGGGLVFIGSQDGSVYAFKARGCGTSALDCSPVWTATARRGANFVARPAVAYGLVYITNFVTGYLYAYPEHCASLCTPRWQAFVGHAAQVDPAVANGVVYLADGLRDTTIYAFSATCATGGRTCSPLWHRGGLALSDPTVAGGEVWAAGGTGLAPATLYAFGLPVPGTPRRGR